MGYGGAIFCPYHDCPFIWCDKSSLFMSSSRLFKTCPKGLPHAERTAWTVGEPRRNYTVS